MKKKSEKKLTLVKISVANLSQTTQPAMRVKDTSMSAPICSVDSCRF